MSNTKKPPTQVEQKWAEMYVKKNMSLGEISLRTGESRQRIGYALKKVGIKMRKRGDYFVEPRRSV